MRKINIKYSDWARICNYRKVHWRMCVTCCFELTRMSDGGFYHAKAFISLPMFILLFIPATIVDAFSYMWDSGLKNFRFPSRWVNSYYIYPDCSAYDYCEVLWDAKNKD